MTGTIGDQTVETKHIANEAITESEIAPNAVTGEKIGERVINHTHIADGAVTEDKLASGVLVADTATAWHTGDVKLTLASVSPAGWLLMNDGTIGSTSSGATSRANADVKDLYTLLWSNLSDSYAPVQGGRGSSAAVDWAANKPLQLTKVIGRALGVAGNGSGLSRRTLGATIGTERHLLTVAEIPAHTHEYLDRFVYTPNNLSRRVRLDSDSPYGTQAGTTPNRTTQSTGEGGSHNNMQPTVFLNTMIKL